MSGLKLLLRAMCGSMVLLQLRSLMASMAHVAKGTHRNHEL